MFISGKSFITNSKGFSLVELLVAGVIGLILLGGVISVFLGSKTTYRMQEQLAGVQTEGRFALMFLERIVQNAGWQDGVPQSDDIVAIAGVDNSFSGTSFDEVSATMFNMENTVDCNGVAITDNDVTNRFYVDVDGTLICEGSGGGRPQPIIENVESFQVLYGIDTDADGLVNRYLTANAVGDFTRVLAIKIAILVASEGNATPESIEQDFDVLGDAFNATDQRVRRLFQTTINVPNQSYPIIREVR